MCSARWGPRIIAIHTVKQGRIEKHISQPKGFASRSAKLKKQRKRVFPSACEERKALEEPDFELCPGSSDLEKLGWAAGWFWGLDGKRKQNGLPIMLWSIIGLLDELVNVLRFCSISQLGIYPCNSKTGALCPAEHPLVFGVPRVGHTNLSVPVLLWAGEDGWAFGGLVATGMGSGVAQ